MKLLFAKSALVLTLLNTGLVNAETNYVIDEFQPGIHKEADIDSPIIKLVPSGTTLEVLSRNDVFVQVKDTEGQTGWVHQRYLINQAPDNTQVLALQKQNRQLESEIKALQQTQQTSSNEDCQELQRLLKSEKLQVGELQAKLADIKARIAAGSDAAMSDEIERLRQANEELVSQLALSGDDKEKNTATVLTQVNNWKAIMITVLVFFIIGFFLGIFLLDWINRKRHGGFRV